MKRHRPNFINLKTRIFLAVSSLFLLVFIVLEVAIGYTFVPGKRGGILLSGIPTLMIATAAGSLLIAAVLTIIDHYDKRPNEATYQSVKSFCYRAALVLFLLAPIVEIVENLLRLMDLFPFPQFHGLAENYSIHSPAMKGYLQQLAPVLENQELIVFPTILTLAVAFVVDRIRPGRASRFVGIMAAAGMLGLSSFWLLHTTKNFLSGQVTEGRRSAKYTYDAVKEPAKFNAVLLTHFSLGTVMFLSSSFALVGLITNRIRPVPALTGARNPPKAKRTTPNASSDTSAASPGSSQQAR